MKRESSSNDTSHYRPERTQPCEHHRTDHKSGNGGSPAPTAMSLPTKSILEIMMRNNASQGKVQYILAAGALSASISSQLIGTITSSYAVAGGIVHATLLLACITGIMTIATHFSSFTNDTAMISTKRRILLVGSVLSHVSLWFSVFGIAVLAWIIQPQPVAIVITALVVLAVLTMIGCSVYELRRKLSNYPGYRY